MESITSHWTGHIQTPTRYIKRLNVLTSVHLTSRLRNAHHPHPTTNKMSWQPPADPFAQGYTDDQAALDAYYASLAQGDNSQHLSHSDTWNPSMYGDEGQLPGGWTDASGSLANQEPQGGYIGYSLDPGSHVPDNNFLSPPPVGGGEESYEPGTYHSNATPSDYQPTTPTRSYSFPLDQTNQGSAQDGLNAAFRRYLRDKSKVYSGASEAEQEDLNREFARHLAQSGEDQTQVGKSDIESQFATSDSSVATSSGKRLIQELGDNDDEVLALSFCRDGFDGEPMASDRRASTFHFE